MPPALFMEIKIHSLVRTLIAVAVVATAFAAPAHASEDNWTVLTIASDGSWGVATKISSNLAIAAAIADCKAMSRAEIGCGAYIKAIRAGWILGVRCGGENIIASGTTLAEAEQAAVKREVELRQMYLYDMPPCKRLITVDPLGEVVVPHKTFG